MADYHRPIEFGVFLDPSARDPARTIEIAQLIEDAGFDLIGIQDHPYQPRHFDSLALIGFLLGQTTRVRFFPDVANMALRDPMLVAKEASTLDLLSGGRFELGIGAGAFWDAIEAFGGPRRSPAEAVQATREAIALIKAFWRERAIRFEGEAYRVSGAQTGPHPGRDIGIWLGALGPKMLQTTGAISDGWVPSMSYIPPSKTVAMTEIIDTAAMSMDRDPASIRRIYNISGEVSPVLEAGSSPDDTQIVGPIAHWIETLTRLATEYGFDTFVVGMTPTGANLRMFMEDIVPAVRERVQTVRERRAGRSAGEGGMASLDLGPG